MIMTAIRTIILYFVVIICMRIMGKRQVGELQPSEFVVTILISELASIPIQDLNSEEMENACSMKVKLRADVQSGKTWYDCK